MIPALVIAREFRCRHREGSVLFVGTPRGIENRLVPDAGFSLELLQVGLLQGQSAATRVKTLLELPCAVWQASRILDRFQPHVVLGVGGYAAGPVMLAAAWAGIPLAVLEPNAYPGLTNRWIAPYVSRAFIGFPEAASFFPPNKATEAGVPVRQEFFQVSPKPHEPPFTLDRSHFSVGRLHDDDSQVDYWLSQPPERRIEAVEFLRGAFDPEAYSAQRLRRFFETAKRA